VGECCWILSEMTWILLIPEACIPTGILAILLLGGLGARTCRYAGGRSPTCSTGGCKRLTQWLPPVLQVSWLLTNFTWMFLELLWDTPDQQTPWRRTPMAGEHEDLYDEAQFYCVLTFLVTPTVWSLAVAALFLRGCRRLQDGPGRCWRSCRPACALFCQAGYISSWALMDAVWAAGLLWFSMVSCVLTIILIAANAAWETGLGLGGFDRTDFVWVLWTLANAGWIVDELSAGDDLTLRYVSAGFALASFVVLLCSWHQAVARHIIRSGCTDGASWLGERCIPEPQAEAPACLGA